MERSRKPFLLGVLAGVAGTVVLAAVSLALVAYTGSYSVAASEGHTAGMRWLLDSTMQSSVRRHANKDTEDARDRLARADVRAGAAHYQAMCEHCHGGPGVEPAGWSRGMLPRPPEMTHAATEWEAAQIVWIVEHGVKYTGMPSFGASHDEQALWDVAAFVGELPALTPEAYERLTRQAGSHSHAGPAHAGPGAP